MATIVSGYYNLQRDDQYYSPGQGRTHQQYIEHGKSLLSIKLPIIIFCSPEDKEVIIKIRSEVCPKFPISVIDIPFDKLLKYKHYNKMLDLKGRKVHDKYSAGYYLIVHSKVDFMLRSIQENPFNSNFYIWIDFGIRHVTEIPVDIEQRINRLQNINLRLDLLNFIPNDIKEGDIIKFCSDSSSYVAGGCFMGKPEHLKFFCEKVNSYFDYIMENDYICLEEKLFSLFISNYKDKVSPYIARFTSILDNIETLTKDSDLYLYIMEQEANNRGKFIYDLSNYGLKSNINNSIRFKVLDFKLINCWYTDRKDMGIGCILEIMQLTKDREIKKIFDSNLEYYLRNFSYYTDYYKSKNIISL